MNEAIHKKVGPRAAALLIGALGLTGATTTARADLVLDPVGDFLPTYTGPRDPGLDVIAHEVAVTADRLILFGRMAGPVAPTQAIGGVYLFGLDRGRGVPGFLSTPSAPPPIGPNVLFDSVIGILPDGTGLFVDIFTGATTPLDPADIRIAGSEIRADLPLDLFLPGSTRSPDRWTYNLWPRNGLGRNVQVADLGPDDGNSPVRSVPEPSSLWLCAVGLSAAGALLLGRQAVALRGR